MLSEQERKDRLGRLGASDLNKIFETKTYPFSKSVALKEQIEQKTKSRTLPESDLIVEEKGKYIYQKNICTELSNNAFLLRVAHQKAIERIRNCYSNDHGKELPIDESETIITNLVHGNTFEKEALDRLTRDFKDVQMKPAFNSEHTSIHPDACNGTNVFEVKCPLLYTHYCYLRNPEILRKQYMTQVQAQMWATGVSKAWIASYNPYMSDLSRPNIVKIAIKRDDKHIRQIELALDVFATKVKEIQEYYENVK